MLVLTFAFAQETNSPSGPVLGGNVISATLANLGNIANYQGEAATSRRYYDGRYYDESLEIRRAEGDPFGVYLALINLGRMHFSAKEYHTAGAMWRECRAIVGKARAEIGELDKRRYHV